MAGTKRSWSAFDKGSNQTFTESTAPLQLPDPWQNEPQDQIDDFTLLDDPAWWESVEDCVCFGSIAGVKAQLKTRLDETLRQGPDSICFLDIKPAGAYFALYASESRVALLNRQGLIKYKSIAFSSWKKTLDLAGQLLTSHGIKFCCIHGSLSLSKRLKVLQEFRGPMGPSVLLMTMGTGAVGLNLAVASKIYLLEPQWNPSMELQAIGRALRLGQGEHVSIVRYVMKDTVEDSNVLSRQRRKLRLADGGFSSKRNMSADRLETISA
ncbi:DNA repair protein RAD5B [Colletotrichum spinosum]|uniref:DNA repair protein RAD5B n=1 Tax=Colletotrichum spinosum TaxID=1347390 RepID=A0A4R8QHU2_9PEZI|nr:DNA repair protein RAD5B [Colletotrichum spinosum]